MWEKVFNLCSCQGSVSIKITIYPAQKAKLKKKKLSIPRAGMQNNRSSPATCEIENWHSLFGKLLGRTFRSRSYTYPTAQQIGPHAYSRQKCILVSTNDHNTIHNDPNLETTQMLTQIRMDKYKMVYSNNGKTLAMNTNELLFNAKYE